MKQAFPALLLFSATAAAANLQPVVNTELSSVLGLSQEISGKASENKSRYIVRVFAAPEFIGECGGNVKSCPEVGLFISVANGDLGEVPVLYRLPPAKGWQFQGWLPPLASGAAAFILTTSLPESNIQPAARQKWRSQRYVIYATTERASYELQ